MNEILNEGDEVVCITYPRFSNSNNTYYKFDKVVRVTKTTAILGCGIILNREGKKWNIKQPFEFKIKGEHYGDSWQKSTPEIKAAAKAKKEQQLINAWFKDYNFSDEEKKTIYELIKK